MAETSEQDSQGEQPKDMQANIELDPKRVDASLNIDPDNFDIETGELFVQATEQTRMALCVSDSRQADAPIIYCNDAFLELTGYSRDEIIGKNCRMLQGAETDPEAVERIRVALDTRKVAVVDILNYRKDGSAFWNALHIGPIYNSAGKLTHFYGSQWDITEVFRQREEAIRQKQVTEELQHRTGNLFAVMSSIVRMSARGETDAAALADKIERRLGALASAHRISIGSAGQGGNRSDLRGLVDAVVEPYRTDKRNRISVHGDTLELPPQAITPIGLTLHELATNAVKYGSLSNLTGKVRIEWSANDGELAICWTERGGPDIARGDDGQPTGTGTGSRIVSGILAGIDATIERNFGPDGLSATIRMPSNFEHRIERS